MAIFIQDSFTEASDVELSLHTPDVGGAWAKHPAYVTNGTVVASEDRFRGNSSSVSSLYVNATTPPSDDYEISWVAQQVSVGSQSRSGAVARYSALEDSGYSVYYNGSQWTFAVTISGVTTELAFWNGSETAGINYTVRWVIDQDMHEVYFDGTLRMSVRSNTFLAAGQVGVLCRLNGRVDDFIAQTLAATVNFVPRITAAAIISAVGSPSETRVTGAFMALGTGDTPSETYLTAMQSMVGTQTPAEIRVTGMYLMLARSVIGTDTPPPGSGVNIYAWDSSPFRRPYRWRSALFLNPHEDSFQIAKIEAEDYDNITFRILRAGVVVFEKVVTSDKEFVVNPVSQNRTQIEIEGTSRVYTVQLAQRVEELT